MKIRWLSNGLYSLKNYHIPFGMGFQPPRPYGRIPFEQHLCYTGLPLDRSVGGATSTNDGSLWKTKYRIWACVVKDLNFKRISKKSQYGSASDNFIFSSKRIETDLLLTLFLFSSSSELRFRKAPLLPINPLCLGLAIKENQVWPKFMFWLDSLSISLLWPVIFTHSIKMCHLGKTWEALIISMWFFCFIVFFTFLAIIPPVPHMIAVNLIGRWQKVEIRRELGNCSFGGCTPVQPPPLMGGAGLETPMDSWEQWQKRAFTVHSDLYPFHFQVLWEFLNGSLILMDSNKQQVN